LALCLGLSSEEEEVGLDVVLHGEQAYENG
jgi:ammonia channel protein AmtB